MPPRRVMTVSLMVAHALSTLSLPSVYGISYCGDIVLHGFLSRVNVSRVPSLCVVTDSFTDSLMTQQTHAGTLWRGAAKFPAPQNVGVRLLCHK
jgi:hypothetical protein